MRKEYGKFLRSNFEKWISTNAAEFLLVSKPGKYFWPGEMVFEKRTGQISLAIVLSPNPMGQNSFAIELGWSKLGRLPELMCRPSADAPENAIEFVNDEYMTRLGYLLSPRVEFWEIEGLYSEDGLLKSPLEMAIRGASALGLTEVRSMVEPKLNEATNALKEIGIPYLAAAAKASGCM